ncbi:hypothetical protein IWW43_001410 [Coemansia sp. RSA 1935]|nr:hypothetical protein GGH15_004716 [Coemansia sp. RSA 562]KAJ2202534.1 hypothetical protein IW145_004635 [Coemansia sp. RSA 521]KAJ2268056.1 hypothetical protein J3F81_004849 [Coemansia sp. RSA 371]KAJ2280968.1 hypothetical protein GGH14_002158 [Coemansia sp. RSA 370]KAJ2292093.1 hypothetical protein IW141_002180 [Coemansia sp. RSA 355]KAJ2535733.1 hypothetical protein IWW43_001410 [Coemansia sp. RSA 1935]KAJ2550343.1 hypothetical protein IWW35_003338 [Coemansia sp. RSA 1878]
MKVAFSLGSALMVLAGFANAHTYLSKLALDGVQESEGQCIRPYPADRNYPVKDVTSTDITCGVGGVSKTASETCPVKAGSTITVEWHHDNDSASDDVIDITHLGPCMVYMAPLESNGSGDVWFKIFEDGYDAATSTWCVNKIRNNGGKLDVALPADIKSGDYLVRTEIIALHESDTDYAVNPARGSQFYVNCAQVSVTNGGSAEPQGYAIPGIYKSTTPGVIFNLYSSYSSYPIPGPAVYVSGPGNDIGESPNESTDASAEDSTSAPVENTDSSVEETNYSSVEESTDSSVEETNYSSAEESTDSSVEETNYSSVEESTDSSVEETNYSSAEENTDAPTENTDAPQGSATESPTEYISTDASEAPTSSAPVVTYTTTITAAPGKCH